ncbi:Ferrous iron transport protein B [Desulfosporosinus sp. I2]|uniref:nucleoside recognition domain-containing protein n=1 Tax=Desulfosporosinus sp. I2 TaxID=1617025 RepID=UPI0005EE4497|nr:nucleoside recognition domain-containing protein [Desulfosporosinus sp. I2]KJR49578.1 Ferrous iron transport protein B [Desulfosporosinus sp. I2]
MRPLTPSGSLSDVCGKAESVRNSNLNSLSDQIVADIYGNAELITKQVLSKKKTHQKGLDQRLDDLVTSKWFGYPLMLLMLVIVFWITMEGANFPSRLIASGLFTFQDQLTLWFQWAGTPAWIHGILVLGVYRTLAWVVSVMLPPMAIFFPMFTLLEDSGYLPRIAFNMDHIFKKAKACGKQSLTMCMGFGCNAVGVTSCRIIDSPRERLIAILTNSFVPCNGRFPTLIIVTSIFIGGTFVPYSGFVTAFVISGLILSGIAVTLLVSRVLSVTILKGEPSSLVLELPSYRRPQIGAVIYRSMIDRTIFVLRRAVLAAAPAGAVIWILANTYLGQQSIIVSLAQALNPIGQLIGLDGFILLAFILGLPANEIVLPILLMSYLSTGYLQDLGSLDGLRNVLVNNGWTWLTAINVMLFSLFHWPCATTLLTTYKETGSKKWMFLSFIIPTIIGISVCFILTQVVRSLGLV